MNNEQQKAKELAELLIAFADEKELLCKNSNDCWERYNCKTVADVFKLADRLRVKPETEQIALTQQDLIDRELINRTMRVKRNGEIYNNYFIDEICLSKVKLSNGTHINYDCLSNEYTFLDGTPCYKEVDCE